MELPEEMREAGITKLNPVQEKALATRFIENSANLVVASPTGSGKTLIAELAALECVRHGKKVVYTCPLKALASEHHRTFGKYSKSGVRTALSVGDFDSSDRHLENYDIIATSYEKLDSLMRHKATFMPFVGLLIADEVHLLDSDRGATLETIITRFRHLFPNVQVVALSATVPNSKEIAGWLGAELVESEWRASALSRGVLLGDTIETESGESTLPESKLPAVARLCTQTLERGGETLVFVNTRKGAEAEAERLRQVSKPHCAPKSLASIADSVENVLETPTKQCRKLADCIRSGVAFHHAGLLRKQRELVEDAFRQKKIRIITATPTLALGVNLPAEAVIIRDSQRYTINGLEDIPVREYLQMSGRAGRPNYGKDGVSVLVAGSAAEKTRYWDRYILGKPEKVYSQLGIIPVLRAQTLASIAMGFTPTRQSLERFFLDSFYAFQYKEADSILDQASSLIGELVEMGFVSVSGSSLKATPTGKRVAELYLDPLSAFKMINSLQRKDIGDLGLMYALIDTEEMKPYPRARRKDEQGIWQSARLREQELGFSIDDIAFEQYDFVDKYKALMLMDAWISEMHEERIMEEFSVAPGILREKLLSMDWVCYSASELSRLCGFTRHLPALSNLRLRLKYGAKEELLPLLGLKGVGRMRARRLFSASLKSLKDLKKAPLERVSSVVGPALAASIKRQLGEQVPEEITENGAQGQTRLGDYN